MVPASFPTGYHGATRPTEPGDTVAVCGTFPAGVCLWRLGV